MPSRSECSAAICTARTARTGSRRSRFATRRPPGAPRDLSAEEIAELAVASGAPTVVSTYNEPLITSEWAVEVFRAARAKGLSTAYVSNGNGTPEVLDYIRPWTDFYKVDLKSMDDKHYRQLGGVLANVLETIAGIHARGMWLEVLTLTIPGFNDSDEELKRAAEFIASISRDIPWHVTAFHPDYKMLDHGATPAATLLRAASIGERAGLRYVYAGNLPGRTGQPRKHAVPGMPRDGHRTDRFPGPRRTAWSTAPAPGARRPSPAAGTLPGRELREQMASRCPSSNGRPFSDFGLWTLDSPVGLDPRTAVNRQRGSIV